MAVTPKTGRAAQPGKTDSATLSASEALKAAEAAIEPAPAVRKPAPRKAASSVPAMDANPSAKSVPAMDANPSAKSVPAMDANPSAKSVKATDASPAAIVAATTAVDAMPEPDTEAAAEAAPDAETPKSLDEKAKTNATLPLPATEGTKIMNDVMETGKKFAEDTKAKLETAYADMNEKAKASVEKSTKAIEEMSDIAKGNVEAMVESGKIAAKAMETMSQEAVDYSRKNFEKATAALKSFATVKTPTEFFQLQSQMFSSSFDEFTKEAAKNSEAMMKVAGDIAQPLTARVTLVTDKVKSLAA
ncbi:phasin family protein [Sphingobium sp. SA2]|uniref:phasin family protein n=1 Tax=Sphingobium sp. SA2 TaxID=1524832 RepID=UPI0028C1E8C7|nr:phasin family protein [Sphingobium sp. SA2]MDT7533571.1 phasin family protein [Sphingobium sp. SA2]